jgi:hypothetical protein
MAVATRIRDLRQIHRRRRRAPDGGQGLVDPAADPGKAYVDLIMKGIELLLAELSNKGQKN